MDIFKGMNLLEFTDKFKDDDSCKAYLAFHKWGNGFTCPKCGCQHHHNSKNPYIRRCRDCYHADSVLLGLYFTRLNLGFVKPLRWFFR